MPTLCDLVDERRDRLAERDVRRGRDWLRECRLTRVRIGSEIARPTT